MPAKIIDYESPAIRIHYTLNQISNDETFLRAQQMEINKLAAARMRGRRILEEIIYFEEVVGGFVGLYMVEKLERQYMWLFSNAVYTQAVKKKDDQVDDSDIEEAKRYPIDRLIEFKRGQAIAFCHDDKRPSLFHGTRKNIARCPVCSRSFNPIDVLVYRDGYSFIEAVKQLRNR